MAGEGAHYGYNPIKEDVQQFIYQITSVDTPVYDDIGDSSCGQPVHTWQTRSLTTRADNAQVEGAAFTDTALINTTDVTNKTQIISKVVKVTETTQATQMHAIEDVFGDQMVQRGAEFKTDAEHALIRGSAASGSATDTARRMAGFFNVITTNASAFASGTTFTEAHLNDWIRDINDSGGRAQDLYVGSVLRQRVSTFIANNTRFMDQNEMKTVRPIGVYQSEFFVVTIHFSRDIPTAFGGSTNAALLLDTSQCSKAWLRTPVSFRLPKTNDAQRGVIIGEATLAYGNEASHGLRTILS
jgi:hypothetical protein